MSVSPDGPATPVPTEFTLEVLLSAATAFGGGTGQLRDWGASILGAVGGLSNHRGRPRVGHPLLETFKSAAIFRHQAITPFQGILEAPSEIIAVYQTHKPALRNVESVHRDVLTDVLHDLAVAVMDQLQGASWPELEHLGADRQRPAQVASYDEEDF